MIMEPASRDKIERSVVVEVPIPSVLAIGQSIIVVTQIRINYRRHSNKDAWRNRWETEPSLSVYRLRRTRLLSR